MRKIFKIIKENFFLLILLLGVGLFTNSLFSFDSASYFINGVGSEFDFIGELPSGVESTYYSYDYSTRGNLTIGAILIVFGLIKIRTKKEKN